MIDRIFAYTAQRRESGLDPDYSADQATSEQLYMAAPESPAPMLTTVFGFWNARPDVMTKIGENLTHQGSDALVYSLNPNILNDNPTLVRDGFEQSALKAVHRIQELRENNRYSKINLLGFSTGNVPLSMTAAKLEHFDDVTMVVPGSDVFLCIWNGLRTQVLRHRIEKRMPAAEVESIWKSCAPINYVDALKGHNVKVILSRNDKYIPYRFGHALVERMRQRGVTPKVIVKRRIGHALTIGNFIRQM